jgi:hypothetical protein
VIKVHNDLPNFFSCVPVISVWTDSVLSLPQSIFGGCAPPVAGEVMGKSEINVLDHS